MKIHIAYSIDVDSPRRPCVASADVDGYRFRVNEETWGGAKTTLLIAVRRYIERPKNEECELDAG